MTNLAVLKRIYFELVINSTWFTFQNHTSSLEDHGRQLSKTIQDVASKLSGAKKAGGMFNKMMSSTSASLSGANIASAIANNLSPRRASIQDGMAEDAADSAVEAALLEASYDETQLEADLKSASLDTRQSDASQSSRSWSTSDIFILWCEFVMHAPESTLYFIPI